MEPGNEPAGTRGDQPARYPVEFSVAYPDRPLNRLTTAFRLITVIPIGIVIASIGGGDTRWGSAGHTTTIALGGTAGLLFVPPLLMIVFRQKYPRWWFDWNLELLRFSNRVTAYVALLDDRYPSTDEHQSVTPRVSLPGRERRTEPLAADRQVAARHPPLHHRRPALDRGVLRGRARLVRDPLHRPVPPRSLRLRRRRAALVESRGRLRARPRHRRVPALPLEAITNESEGAPRLRGAPRDSRRLCGLGE